MQSWWLKAQLRCGPWSGLGADATSAWPVQAVAWKPLTEQVHALILKRAWSPEQIAGRLRVEHPDDSSQRVCHETIYQHIYAHPAGELKKMLIDALRKGHQKRRPRSRGKDRRGGIRNMRSIRERPEEAQPREVPGHWEGDLIKGAFNGSAIGTLVDRSTRFVILNQGQIYVGRIINACMPSNIVIRDSIFVTVHHPVLHVSF